MLAHASASGTTAHQALSRRTSTAHQTMSAASTGSVQAWSTWVSVPGASTSTAVTAAARSTRPRASAHNPANSTSDQKSTAQRTSPAIQRPGAVSTAIHGR